MLNLRVFLNLIEVDNPMPRYIAPFALIFVFVSSMAAPSDPKPGNYIAMEDSGSVTIQRDQQNRLTFEIETVGANYHTCQLSGVIQNAVGHTEDNAGQRCDVSFESGNSAVTVRPITLEACRDYCGMRAGFEGIYRIPPSNCTSEGRQAQRDKSLLLYRAHRYPEAVAILRTLTSQCTDFIGWIELDQVRNDIALAQYHNGEYPQCLETLNSTIAGKVKGEAELKSGDGGVYLPPSDFDNYSNVAASTWFNKALCAKALKKKP
jgi:hypothetical protein